MRGRKPKPTEQKRLAGNPGCRPLNENEPPSLDGVPEPPEIIQGEARAEWYRVCADLKAMGILSQADRPALAAYCNCWAQFVDLADKYDKTGALHKAMNGKVTRNPLFGMLRETREELRKLATEFGLTPSSKSRLQVSEKPHAEEGKRRFFAG